MILAFGGGGPWTLPGLEGFKVALDAIEGLRRQWACELGQHGIRVVTLKTGDVPETIPEGFPGREAIGESIRRATLLNRAATLADVGNVAAFVASDPPARSRLQRSTSSVARPSSRDAVRRPRSGTAARASKCFR